MINCCIDELIDIVNTATWGQSDRRRAGQVMTRAGTGGAGRLEHVNIRTEGHMARATVSYEVGEVVRAQRVTKGDLMYLTTPNRMYIVRADFPTSESLGVWEARVTGPQDQDCSLIVHLAGSRYQAMTKGDMTCYTAEGHGISHLNQAYQQFSLGGEEKSCSTRCLSVGPRGFKTEVRTLDPVPNIHPAMLRTVGELKGSPNPLDLNKDRLTYNRLHDIIQKDVKENKDMLADMKDKDNDDIWKIDHWNIGLGGILSLIVLSAIAASLFLLVRRGATCCQPGWTAPPANLHHMENAQGIVKIK